MKKPSRIKRSREIRALIYTLLGERSNTTIARRAYELTMNYRGRPRDMVHIAVASIIIAARELGYELNTNELLSKARLLTNCKLSTSTLLRLLSELKPNRTSHDLSKISIMYAVRIISSLPLPTAIKRRLLDHIHEAKDFPAFTGMTPQWKGVALVMYALAREGLLNNTYLKEISSLTGCPKSSIYRIREKVISALWKYRSKLVSQVQIR